MSDTIRQATGTGDAPLVATQRYTFQHVVTAAGEAKLTIPYVQRGSWDDHGIVERPEQERFVARLLASPDLSAKTGYPGEWIFPDVATLDRAWAALAAALRDPAATPPAATARRSVSREEAQAVAGGLTQRYLDLVSDVLGLSGAAFVRIHSQIDDAGWDPTRSERWRRGEVVVCLDATGIASGHGVHGERCNLTLASPPADGRDVGVYADIDMRSGGNVHITVRGVLDAQALADRFVAAAP
jgi:hypothetical protein